MDTTTAAPAPVVPPPTRSSRPRPCASGVDVRAARAPATSGCCSRRTRSRRIGSEVTVLALPLAAALLLGATPLQMGLLTAAGTAPYIGFALVVRACADRLRRWRPLMIAADLAAFVALLTVPLAWALDLATTTELIAVELVVGVARVASGRPSPPICPTSSRTWP